MTDWDEAQLTELAVRLREAGDRKWLSEVEQCELLKHLFGDRRALAFVASKCDWTEQRLVKYAGAGAVSAVVDPPSELWSTEWGYQLSLFPQADWEWVTAVATALAMNSSDLRKLRGWVEMASALGYHVCLVRGCEHGRRSEAAPLGAGEVQVEMRDL